MLPHYQALALRDKAARESLDMIARDQSKLSMKYAKVLEYLGQKSHLFDPELTVGRIKSACGIRDNAFSTIFHLATGLTPSLYIREHRFQTASRLLLTTSMPVSQIAETVGYLAPDAFSRTFQKWSGERPAAFRRSRCGSMRDSMPQKEKDSSDEMQAQMLWNIIDAWPFEEQRRFFRQQHDFPDPLLFEFLRRKSQETVRHDPKRGLEIAELAVEAVSIFDRTTEEKAARLFAATPPLSFVDIVALKARAWSWLGNIRGLMLDYSGSEQAFQRAGYLLRALPDTCPACGEFHWLKALLYWYQNQPLEAEILARRAVAIFRLHGDSRSLSEALLVHGAIVRHQGDTQTALECFQEVHESLDVEKDRELSFASIFEAANTYEQMGEYRKAASLLPQIGEFSACKEIRSRRPYIAWLEARIYRGLGDLDQAEERLLQARRIFLECSQSSYAAAVSLDLAWISGQKGDSKKATRRAREVIPFFQSYSRPEALVALTLLQESIEKQAVDLSLIERLKSVFEDLRRDPTLKL